MIVRTNYQQKEDKIYVYDEIMPDKQSNSQNQSQKVRKLHGKQINGGSPIKTFNSSCDDSSSGCSSVKDDELNSYGDSYDQSNASSSSCSQQNYNYSQKGYGRQPNVQPLPQSQSDFIQPLETIQEGGSSVSSGQHSYRHITTNCNNNLHQYFQTHTTNSKNDQQIYQDEDESSHQILNSTLKNQTNQTQGSEPSNSKLGYYTRSYSKKVLKTEDDYQEYQNQLNNQMFSFPVQNHEQYLNTQQYNVSGQYSPKNYDKINDSSLYLQNSNHNQEIGDKENNLGFKSKAKKKSGKKSTKKQEQNKQLFKGYGNNCFIYEVNQMRLQNPNVVTQNFTNQLLQLNTQQKSDSKISFGNNTGNSSGSLSRTPMNFMNQTNLLNQQTLQLGREISGTSQSNYLFNSAERQVKAQTKLGGCSSSRYRYDSREDDEEDEMYSNCFVNEGQENQHILSNFNDQSIDKQFKKQNQHIKIDQQDTKVTKNIDFLEYKIASSSSQNDSSDSDNSSNQQLSDPKIQYYQEEQFINRGDSSSCANHASILSFPQNTALVYPVQSNQKQYQTYVQSISDANSSNVAEVSIVNNAVSNNLAQNLKRNQNPSLISNDQLINDRNSNIIMLRHQRSQSRGTQNSRLKNRTASVMTASTILDEDSIFFDEKPIIQPLNYVSQLSKKQQQFEILYQVNPGKILNNHSNKKNLVNIQRAPQMKGDDEDDDENLNFNSFSKISIQPISKQQQSIEFRDPQTNEIFLRASIQEASRHLRKISYMMEQQQNINQQQNQSHAQDIFTNSNTNSQQVSAQVAGGAFNNQNFLRSIEQGNTEESEVPPDTERNEDTKIAGQRISVIKSILQKMLVMQSQPQNSPKSQHHRQAQQNDFVQWSKDEMVALTDIFKNIVHTEIENKQQTTLSKGTNNSLLIYEQLETKNPQSLTKMNELQIQNERLAREVEELKIKLQMSSSINNSQKSRFNGELQVDHERSQNSIIHSLSNYSNKSMRKSPANESNKFSMKQNIKQSAQTRNIKSKIKTQRTMSKQTSIHNNDQLIMNTSNSNFNHNSRLSHYQAASNKPTNLLNNNELALQVKKQGITAQLNSSKLTKATSTNANSSRGSFVNSQNQVYDGQKKQLSINSALKNVLNSTNQQPAINNNGIGNRKMSASTSKSKISNSLNVNSTKEANSARYNQKIISNAQQDSGKHNIVNFQMQNSQKVSQFLRQ
eukprot:403361819